MPWPFRRTPRLPADRPGRYWARLPAMRRTVQLSAPLTLRSLSAVSIVERTVHTDADRPPPGRVTGLATAAAEPVDVLPVQHRVAPASAVAKPVARAVRVRPAAVRGPLTVADSRFVGAPLAAERPFQHLTEMERMAEFFENMPIGEALRMATTGALPGLSASPEQSVDPEPPRPVRQDDESQQSQQFPRPGRTARPQVPGRASLAESRRRGITTPGAPPAASGTAGHLGEPAAGPATVRSHPPANAPGPAGRSVHIGQSAAEVVAPAGTGQPLPSPPVPAAGIVARLSQAASRESVSPATPGPSVPVPATPAPATPESGPAVPGRHIAAPPEARPSPAPQAAPPRPARPETRGPAGSPTEAPPRDGAPPLLDARRTGSAGSPAEPGGPVSRGAAMAADRGTESLGTEPPGTEPPDPVAADAPRAAGGHAGDRPPPAAAGGDPGPATTAEQPLTVRPRSLPARTPSRTAGDAVPPSTGVLASPVRVSGIDHPRRPPLHWSAPGRPRPMPLATQRPTPSLADEAPVVPLRRRPAAPALPNTTGAPGGDVPAWPSAVADRSGAKTASGVHPSRPTAAAMPLPTSTSGAIPATSIPDTSIPDTSDFDNPEFDNPGFAVPPRRMAQPPPGPGAWVAAGAAGPALPDTVVTELGLMFGVPNAEVDTGQRPPATSSTTPPPVDQPSPSTRGGRGYGYGYADPRPEGYLPPSSPPPDPVTPRTGAPPAYRSMAPVPPSPASPAGDDPHPPDGTGAHTCPDLEDARVLDALAGRLYRFLRTRLRAELLVDRERSGRLADLI